MITYYGDIKMYHFTNNKTKRDQVEYFFSSSATGNKFVSNGYNNSIRIQSIPNYNSDVSIKAVNKSSLVSSNIISFDICSVQPYLFPYLAIAEGKIY